MTDDSAWRDRPNRVPWPPIILVSVALGAIALGHLVPIHADFFPSVRPRAAGFGVVMMGVALDVAAMVQMRRHRANILPHLAATALVTTGVFAWSRNPIYLGNIIGLAGAAFALGNPWFLLAAALAAVGTQALAIRREEAHLLAKFQDQWTVGGFKWSSQHPDAGDCDGGSEAAFGTIWAGTVGVAGPAAGGGTGGAATVLGGDRGRLVQ